jgi:hypothetical protein
MPEYWLDADSLIRAHRGPYSFSYGTALWDFLEAKAHESVIGSPQTVFDELSTTEKIDDKDRLELWARELRGVLFLPPEPSVQVEYGKVVNYVQNNSRYRQQWIASWLAGADPWIVAYPMALGGRIVTFEKPAPTGKKPKIPDVAQQFGIKCLTIWDMLTELAFKIG